MPRPKSGERPLSIRMPDELTADVVREAQKLAGRSVGDFIKDAIELKLKLAWAIQADWYVLREIDPVALRLHGPTNATPVIQRKPNHDCGLN